MGREGGENEGGGGRGRGGEDGQPRPAHEDDGRQRYAMVVPGLRGWWRCSSEVVKRHRRAGTRKPGAQPSTVASGGRGQPGRAPVDTSGPVRTTCIDRRTTLSAWLWRVKRRGAGGSPSTYTTLGCAPPLRIGPASRGRRNACMFTRCESRSTRSLIRPQRGPCMQYSIYACRWHGYSSVGNNVGDEVPSRNLAKLRPSIHLARPKLPRPRLVARLAAALFWSSGVAPARDARPLTVASKERTSNMRKGHTRLPHAADPPVEGQPA